LFCCFSSCVPHVASFSGLSFLIVSSVCTGRGEKNAEVGSDL
jgi:hypothetical protein